MLFGTLSSNARAQSTGPAKETGVYSPAPVYDALTEDQWRRVDRGVDKGLAWLANQQLPDGSFPTHIGGQPAVTALAAMAFLSRGHQPGMGPYGETLDLAIDYALSCQGGDGLFLLDSTNHPVERWNRGSHTALYNHAITGLMLGEAYGITDRERGRRIKPAIERALTVARTMQMRSDKLPLDKHGWRYHGTFNRPSKGNADLSVTGWFVMFYRSAKNAEFDVPEKYVEQAIEHVRHCYNPREGAFHYGPYREDRNVGRGMTGAGLLCLTVSGQRDEEIAHAAGQYLLRNPFRIYNERVGYHDRFHYGAYYCSQAMFLLGGDYWREFYPVLANTLISNQSPSGAWSPESHGDRVFGQTYTSALSVLSLTPPYQLLPIYQR